MLLAFCGIDGCGKSTQIVLLERWLRGRGHDVLVTRQPTDAYRSHPHVRAYLDHGDQGIGMIGLALLAAADRQYHVRNVVKPALALGQYVITDRYVYSTFAFMAARGVDLGFVRTINPDVPRPDITFLLDLDATEALRRVRLRDDDNVKYEERSIDFMNTVRRNFLVVRDESFVLLDATMSTEAIAARVRSEVLAREQAYGLSRALK